MHSTAVVKKNIAAQDSKQLAALVKCIAVNHLRLHRMKEGFHERIVSHPADRGLACWKRGLPIKAIGCLRTQSAATKPIPRLYTLPDLK